MSRMLREQDRLIKSVERIWQAVRLSSVHKSNVPSQHTPQDKYERSLHDIEKNMGIEVGIKLYSDTLVSASMMSNLPWSVIRLTSEINQLNETVAIKRSNETFLIKCNILIETLFYQSWQGIFLCKLVYLLFQLHQFRIR